VKAERGEILKRPNEAVKLFFTKLSKDGFWQCFSCREMYPDGLLADVEVEYEGTVYRVPICLNCLQEWRMVDVIFRKEGGMIWRNGDKLFVIGEDPEGEVEILGKRYKILKEVKDPKERLALDPLGELALSLGLEECPYHPGIFYREFCPVCYDEMVERIADEIHDMEKAR
jgi:ribosomal protein L37AE/L43A